MESTTSIATAVSTSAMAILAIVGLIYKGISLLLSAREARRFELSRKSRIEVVNIEIKGGDVTILVRNRSHIPTILFQPEFDIRGSRFAGSTITQPDRITLGSKGYATFVIGTDEEFYDLSPSECLFVESGEEYGA